MPPSLRLVRVRIEACLAIVNAERCSYESRKRAREQIAMWERYVRDRRPA